MIGGTSRLCMQHIYPKMETKVNICFSFLFFSFPPFEYRFDPTNPHSRT